MVLLPISAQAIKIPRDNRLPNYLFWGKKQAPVAEEQALLLVLISPSSEGLPDQVVTVAFPESWKRPTAAAT